MIPSITARSRIPGGCAGGRFSLAMIFSLLFLFCSFSLDSRAQPIDSLTANAFDTALARFASSPSLEHASWGFCAVDAGTGQVYRSINEQLSLMPASTLKPFTSAAALSLLGKDYRFRTSISISGSIDSLGVLNGNLYVIGGGDPTLGSSRFKSGVSIDTLFLHVWEALRDSGIRSIRGAVVADASCFTGIPVSPAWQYEDIGNYYGAPAMGLSVYENSVEFILGPGKKKGDPVRLLGTFPAIPYLETVAEVTTGPKGSGDRANVYGAPFSNFRWITGTVPAGVKEFSVFGSNPDPPYYLAFALNNYLAARGVEILEQPTTTTRMRWMGEKDTLAVLRLMEYYSPPLSEIVYFLNMGSVNLYAEALLKILGKERRGEGTSEAGIGEVVAFWQKQGLNLSGLSIRDGSGLGRKDLVTVAILANALALYSKDANYPVLYASLPVAGVSGAVSNRFRKTTAQGNLRSKTGTLAGVKGFSGYATTRSGKVLAYSLLVNNYSGTHADLMKKIEALLTVLCEVKD